MKVSKLFSGVKARARETRAYGAVKEYQYDPAPLGLGTIVKCVGAICAWTLLVIIVTYLKTTWGYNEAFEASKRDEIAKARREAAADARAEYARQDKDRAAIAATEALSAARDAKSAAAIARYLAATKSNCIVDPQAKAGIAAIYQEANQ